MLGIVYVSLGLLSLTTSINGTVINGMKLNIKPCKRFGSFQSIVHEVLDNELRKYEFSDGVVIDGYPRNIEQLNYFEKKVCKKKKLFFFFFL